MREVLSSKLSLFIVFAASIFSIHPVWALPKEIIIIRHADKLKQLKPGPTLSPKGEARAVKFALYYLKKFGEPDYIFASNPTLNGKGSSLRELQTVAPLANILAKRHPTVGPGILHTYHRMDESQLAHGILSDKKFDGKQILICWDHNRVGKLVTALGVKRFFDRWEKDDYDKVYVIQYHSNAVQFWVLKKQYEVSFEGSWEAVDRQLR
jgi:hypothetical protein